MTQPGAVDLSGILRGLDGSTLSAAEAAVLDPDQMTLVLVHEACHVDVKACLLTRPDATEAPVARIVAHVEPAVPTTIAAEYENAAVMAESLGEFLTQGFAPVGGVVSVHLSPPREPLRAHLIVITVALAALVEAGVSALGLTAALVRAHPGDFAVEPDEPGD